MPKRGDIRKVLIIGSGPIQIGQAAEFDFSGSQACQALREEGIEVVLVNSNPATIQTDPDMADVIYIEPLKAGIIAEIIRKERPDGILSGMGGQTGLNLTTGSRRWEHSRAWRYSGRRLMRSTEEKIGNSSVT